MTSRVPCDALRRPSATAALAVVITGFAFAVLATADVALVLAGQGLISSFAGASDLAIAASTLVVAALSMQPTRVLLWRQETVGR